MNFKWGMCAFVCAVLFCGTTARAATTTTIKYRNLEDSTLEDLGANGTGWGSCIVCAGGGSDNAAIATSPFQTTPSKDGASRNFSISGDPYSNGLWWYKVGPNDAATTFTFDFWLYTDSSTQAAQALEFDTFQFAGGYEYMFGAQCDYASGYWDLWNGGAQKWARSKVQCKKFAANVWYHITLAYHRTTKDNNLHYDTLTIVQYKPNGRTASNNSYNLKTTYGSQLTPPTWGENLGVQFQMDIGSQGASMQEWIDQVTLTAK